MDVSPEVVDLGVRLAESLARNTATAISDKVRGLKAAGKKDETIAGLEELVSDLIADKAEVTRIAQSYQQELVSQRLTPGDVKYIADTVIPLIENVAHASGAQGEALLKQIDAIKPVLSVETANVLQILGFNFRKAIGEPLTQLLEHAILSRVERSEELKIQSAKREQLYIELALDADAYERFRELFSRN